MAFYDTTWYANSVGYAAVTVRPQNTAVVAGVLRRQFTTPSVGNERVFVCIVAGTTANTTDATWTLTRGAKSTDGTATWQECTGASAVNGDLTNTPTWTAAKAIGNPTLGAIIKRDNGASYWICSTAGTLGASEPAWSNNTAGTTRTDNTVTWTCLGVIANFTGGQAPFARLQSAVASTWFVSGNTVYVGDNHAETQSANMTLSPSSLLMAKILCHNHSGSYPPAASDLTTGATISTTGSAQILITAAGSFYFYGITFAAGSGGTTGRMILVGASSISQTQNWYYFDHCSIQIGGTGANTYMMFGDSPATTWANVVFDNTTVKVADVGQTMHLANCYFTWKNTGQILVSGSSIPTPLFEANSIIGSLVSTLVLEALDLSQLTGMVWGPAIANVLNSVLIKDCKFNASTTIGTPACTGTTIQMVRCDSGATAYKSSRYQYEGTETTETSITRVGGAEDPTGQAQSRKIVTTANAQWLRPFQAEPYAIWNSATGATVTVTIYGTVNAGAVPNNDDIWIEVEYLGDSGFPLGKIVTTTKASLLATNAAVTSDGSTWNGGGSGGGWSPFKLVATLSSPQPAMIGYLDVRVRAAKVSTTYYIDPKIELT